MFLDILYHNMVSYLFIIRLFMKLVRPDNCKLHAENITNIVKEKKGIFENVLRRIMTVLFFYIKFYNLHD